MFVWYPKEREDLKIIHDGNNLQTDDELVNIRDFLRTTKYACFYKRIEHPDVFKVLI